jgi:hypothetical protein
MNVTKVTKPWKLKIIISRWDIFFPISLGGLERGGESKKSMSPHNSKSNHHDEELEGDQSFSWLNLGSSPKSYFASPDLCLAQRIEAIAQKNRGVARALKSLSIHSGKKGSI